MLHGQLNGIAGGRDAKAVRVLDGYIASGPKITRGLGSAKSKHLNKPEPCKGSLILIKINRLIDHLFL